jgi:hypothetical protein
MASGKIPDISKTRKIPITIIDTGHTFVTSDKIPSHTFTTYCMNTGFIHTVVEIRGSLLAVDLVVRRHVVGFLVNWIRDYIRQISGDDLVDAFRLVKSQITQEQFNKFYKDFLFYKCCAIVTSSCIYGCPSAEEQRETDLATLRKIGRGLVDPGKLPEGETLRMMCDSARTGLSDTLNEFFQC